MRHFEREALIWTSSLDAESKLILLALNQYLGSNDSAWPSMEKLARDTSLTRITIVRRLKSLELKQVVVINRRSTHGMKTSSQYKIQWSSLGVLSVSQNPELSKTGCIRETQPELLGLDSEPQENQMHLSDTTEKSDVSERSPRCIREIHRCIREIHRSNPIDLIHIDLIQEREEAASAACPVEDFHPLPEEAEPSAPKSLATESTESSSHSNANSLDRIESSAPAKKSRKRKKITVGESLALMGSDEERECFIKAYVWYCTLVKSLGAKPGDKALAAVAWVEQGIYVQLDLFREGCRLFQKSHQGQKPSKAYGIPHFCNFIAGSSDHPTPYWKLELDINEAESAASDFIPAPAVQQPSRPSHPSFRVVTTEDDERERMRRSAASPFGSDIEIYR